MKRLFFASIVLTALLSMTVGTAFAGSALELVSVQNNGGGPTFTFRVNGEFSPDELSGGFVQVEGGEVFQLYCAQTAPDTVVCHTSKKVGGHDVVIGFGGARFWEYVPETFIHASVCYPAYVLSSPYPDFPTEPPGFQYWRDECTEEEPQDSFISFQAYYLPGAPSGWNDYFFFLSSDPGILPPFEFQGPAYYQGIRDD
jgi:hypothetical protein